MQVSTAVAVITTTVVAIGAALSVTMSGDRTSQIDNFQQIVFLRQIEHGQNTIFGGCPLERELVVERSGRVRINWYVQSSIIHGCARAINPTADQIGQKEWREPKIASIELALSRSKINQLVGQLNRLSWAIEWSDPENLRSAHAIGCAAADWSPPTPDRQLWVVKSDTLAAILAADEDEVEATAACIAKESSNAAMLDDAFAPFAPLLPDKYELRPEVASRLDRER